MEKTTVYLTADQKAALAAAARAEGRSEATLIRAGIDLVTARHRTGGATRPYLSAGEPPGSTVAEDVGEADRRLTWMPRAVFIRDILSHQADAGLQKELRELAGGTTDDEPIP